MESFYGQNASHECNYCSKMLPTHAELVEHKKTHVGDRPFSCHICNKRFTQKAHLNIHKRTHTGEKPYACQVCHKRFAQSSHLNSHKRIHAGDRPFYCVVCNTGFSQKHRFDAHLPCMQHSQSSRNSAPMSGTGTSSLRAGQTFLNKEQLATLTSTASAAAAYTVSGGGEEDASSMQDQKPDINFLNTLNQALMQQLADMSGDSVGGGVSAGMGVGAEEAGSNAQGATGYGDQGQGQLTIDDSKSQGSVSSAYMPASSTHRRKPAFIRRVDNEEMEESSGQQVSEADNDTVISGNNGFQDTDYDEESTDFDEDNAEFSLENGRLKSHQNERRSSPARHALGPMPANQSLLPTRISPAEKATNGNGATGERAEPLPVAQVRTNHRISLVNFTAEELITHLMSRTDVHRCDFCRLIFQDAAMYHIHRNMHDKNDLRCCNFCGKLLQDKYDFAAHFLNEHR